MTARDLERSCRQCGDSFVFSAEQRASFAARALTPPKHCPRCRSARRRAAGPREREAFPAQPPPPEVEAVCAACGAPVRLPFEPTAARPVYCAVCFRNR